MLIMHSVNLCGHNPAEIQAILQVDFTRSSARISIILHLVADGAAGGESRAYGTRDRVAMLVVCYLVFAG